MLIRAHTKRVSLSIQFVRRHFPLTLFDSEHSDSDRLLTRYTERNLRKLYYISKPKDPLYVRKIMYI